MAHHDTTANQLFRAFCHDSHSIHDFHESITVSNKIGGEDPNSDTHRAAVDFGPKARVAAPTEPTEKTSPRRHSLF